jgi:multidrug efflux pump subunit AcrA (membrane-fusion protein)
MTERTGRPWLNYVLGLLCVGAIVAGILLVGPASGNQTAATRTAKAALGVVQSTVSGSGNLAPASQLDLGFKTGGTITHIYVHQGQYVTQGRLLATLDPQSAEVTLEQAKAALLSAEANLARVKETDGESTTTESGGSGTAAGANGTGAAANSTAASANGTGTDANGTGASAGSRTTAGTPADSTSSKTVPEREKQASSNSVASSTTLSAATREANIASAQAAVNSDRLTVRSDQEAVQDTKLYAAQDGTIVSLSGQVGEVVSASGTSKATSLGSSTGTSGSASSGAGASSASGRSGGGSSSSSGSGSAGTSSSTGSSSSPFAVLSDLSAMQLVVALSESEISHVKVGQIATVTIEALEGRKLAAHVSEVAILSTSSSGVVSYDVTFQLDQMTSALRPGMSATAEVVVKQAEGVNIPTSAVSSGSVTVVRGGHSVRQAVVTGLAGNSSTIVLNGLRAGETVVLPQATTNSNTSGLGSALRSRLGRGSLGAGVGGTGGGGTGGGGTGGGGGSLFFRGAGQ